MLPYRLDDNGLVIPIRRIAPLGSDASGEVIVAGDTR